MRFNTRMPADLRPFYQKELDGYTTAYLSRDLSTAWQHLERAHIIGQRYPYQHTFIHWKMLQFGFRIKSAREILGQIPRLLVGGVKSFVGKIPIGNPGGANVPPLKPFPIAADLQEVFAIVGVR